MGSLAAAMPAAADWPIYLSGSVGAQFIEDQVKPGLHNFSADPGFSGNIAAGTRLLDQVRAEVELGYSHSSPSRITPLFGPSFAVGGNIDAFTGTLNGFYDIPTGTIVTPYVGGGIGFVNYSATVTFNGFTLNRISDRTDFLWQAEGGAAIKIADRLAVVPAYRFQQAIEHTPNNVGNVSTHIVKIGLRYELY